ncbi:TolC family protein [Zhouia spongiae]|uniref:TolC family protein n=1 Tax=Zhouia spongiae TaxID=2202721 RepID=A0ABY3YQ13_9FLAO|nr:TolC family protein [Zhouia spongiae]UNY99228.1 TolC family protein [Zhouia spongiae]
MMNSINIAPYKKWGIICVIAISSLYSCVPALESVQENRAIPEQYENKTDDTTNTALLSWKEYFKDPYLASLIETALNNNQELNIMLQEIKISKSEVKEKKGEYLPFIDLKAGVGVDKVARYTSRGASEATTDIKPGREMPEPLPDFFVGLQAQWELDIWKKLRNAKKSALLRYFSSVEGKNFMTTNLIAEIANSYYELLALDNQLAIVTQNVEIQSNALKIVKLQKKAAKATELAVRKFEAEVLSTKSLQYTIQQAITETENKINFLTGSFPKHIERDASQFSIIEPNTIVAGVPSQLLQNRPDIKKAELELEASKLDIKVAKARFYPSFDIVAGIGFQAFDTSYLLKSPESLLYNIAGDLTAPLINRNAIKAAYKNANARQIQAVYNYEQTILNAYIEVANQLSNMNNLDKSYKLKTKEVDTLNESIRISNVLFKSARADYMEVLLTQRDALEAKFELIETKMQQMNASVNMYKVLGGGWH